MQKLRESEPELFIKKDSPGYKSIFSSLSHFNTEDNPVILTDEEKSYIDTKRSSKWNKIL